VKRSGGGKQYTHKYNVALGDFGQKKKRGGKIK
jgi:hypothetical protein